MIYNEIRTALAAYHHPELIAAPEGGDGSHVCEIWEDGEVTLTKGGSLYGQRNLHTIVPPLPASLPLDVMPRSTGSHGNVVVRYDDRMTVCKLIAEALAKRELAAKEDAKEAPV